MTVDDFLECLAALPNAKLVHAAQLRDFETYVRRGYVVPRSELFTTSAQEYTPFESDAADVERMDCDEDCFGNLVDQGNASKNGKGIPNVYGPITLYFKPAAMANANATEVTVRRNAIWSSNASFTDVLDCAGILGLYDAAGYAKSGEFQIHDGALCLADVAYVTVTPITVRGQTLKARVEQLLAGTLNRRGYPISVYERGMSPEGRSIYDQLVTWAANLETNEGAYETLPASVQTNFSALGKFKVSNLERFANYLEHGTFSRLRSERGHLSAMVAFESEYDEPEDIDDNDIGRITVLDTDVLFDRDTALHQMELAEFRLIQACLPANDDNEETRAERIDLAWRNYGEAITDLNYWIEETRRLILGGQNDLHESDPDAHDSQLSANLSGWADEFEEIDFPDLDPSAPEHALVDWRQVRNYSESGW